MWGTYSKQKHLLHLHLTSLPLTLQYPVFKLPPGDQPLGGATADPLAGSSCSETTSNHTSQTNKFKLD